MSNHSAHEIPTTMTPEETREHLRTEREARKQAIEALSDEQLEKITGGSLTDRIHNAGTYAKGTYLAHRDLGATKKDSALLGFQAIKDGLHDGDGKKSTSYVRRSEKPAGV